MLTVQLDDRLRTISAALALTRRPDRPLVATRAAVLDAERPADGPAAQPLLDLLARYVRPQREFLAYGHALALGSAPTFARPQGKPLPPSLLALPALHGDLFPRAMASFFAARDLAGTWQAERAKWDAAVVSLARVLRPLSVATVVGQWFPGSRTPLTVVPDLSGRPGQVIGGSDGDSLVFACAPATGGTAWDAAHVGAAIWLESVRPLVTDLIRAETALEQTRRLGLAPLLAAAPVAKSAGAVGRGASLKHAFLAEHPDLRTRLAEIVARALVAVALADRLSPTVARVWLNEQEATVGGEAVARLASALQRFRRLAPRGTLADFLRAGLMAAEAPLFAAVAG